MTDLVANSTVLPLLRQAAYSELACQFAKFIAREDNSGDALLVLTAALLSEAVSKGHVCLNLAQVGPLGTALDSLLPQHIDDWRNRLRQSHLVGHPGEFTPLVLTESGLLYLYRYWQDEQRVASLIKQRLKPVMISDKAQLLQDFTSWTNTQPGLDWQKVAVLMALTRQFCVISGGPGTGKTTIVLKLLQLLLNQDKTMRIALAAPTGKAAARLQQAIGNKEQSQTGVNLEAKTLHRLLGITANHEQGQYNAKRPLAIDVLIVDEASMVDISMMAKLLKALPQSARLILLGDSQQLASVESGAVLANLCRDDVAFSPAFSAQVVEVIGDKLPNEAASSLLMDSVVILQHSYRFDGQSLIGQMAQAVQTGNEDQFIGVLATADETIWWQQMDQMSIQLRVMSLYQAFFKAVQNQQNARVCLELFEQSRVLCALKRGPESVDSVNYLVERALAKQAWRTHQGFYHGRPIMVTQNDYRQSLFNGDMGLILHDDQGELAACFIDNDALRWIALNRLPAHETAYAMTVHKSQGSEFDKVCIVLPENSTPLLTRELLYTAITRAKKQVSLIATEPMLRQAVITQHQREMGLRMELE